MSSTTSATSTTSGDAGASPGHDVSTGGPLAHVPADLERYLPTPPADALHVAAPVARVTLLEDRAQVQRVARVTLAAGQNRLVIAGVAPVLQDVSLKAEVVRGRARVVDVRARRAMRVRRADRPENVRLLEERIAALTKRAREHVEDRARAEERFHVTNELLEKALGEVSVDAGWGLLDARVFRETTEGLFQRARVLRQKALVEQHSVEELQRELDGLCAQRRAMDRPDARFVAWLELDALAEAHGEVELAIDYVVPNALWRPMHTARLEDDGALAFTSQAVVWQNTGEDWVEAELSFSTARSSLGIEPPTLTDDLLSARKKNEQVVIQTRQVAVQRAAVALSASGGGGGAAPSSPAGVELPGVDDGGEVRNLRAPARRTVPSDGQPNIVPLATFRADPRASLVSFPELDPKTFFKTVQTNLGPHPILAGPVELLRHNGPVGWTETLFVAPGEAFELSFGPDDALRATRYASQTSEVQPVDRWTVTTHTVGVYFSNLSGEAKTVEVTERVPVSEIEQVRVALVADKTTGAVKPDADGFVRWSLAVPGNSVASLALVYTVATAPGVQG